MTKFPVLALTAATLAAGAAGAAQAADAIDPTAPTVWLRLGAFRAGIDSSARVDNASTGAAGTSTDLERDLGLTDSKTLATLALGARFASDWRAGLEFFRVDRNGTQSPGNPLAVGGSIFPATSTVTSKVDAAVYRADAGYSFVRTPQAELGALLGVHVTKFDIDVRGNVALAGQPVQTQREVQNKTVVLPMVGLYGSYTVAPGVALNGRLDGFKIDRGGDNGRLLGMQAGVTYRFNANIGLGLNYRYEDYKVGSTSGSFRGNVAYQLRGPQAFVELGF